MKTLLITAIAAVFALQGNCNSQSFATENKAIKRYIKNPVSLAIRIESGVEEFLRSPGYTFEELNNLPMIDSISPLGSSGYPPFIFDYNEDKRIEDFSIRDRSNEPIHEYTSTTKYNGTYYYKNNLLSSIEIAGYYDKYGDSIPSTDRTEAIIHKENFSYEYDSLNRLISKIWNEIDVEIPGYIYVKKLKSTKHFFEYDNNGNLMKETLTAFEDKDTASSTVVNYEYDEQNRLTNEVFVNRREVTDLAHVTIQYSYKDLENDQIQIVSSRITKLTGSLVLNFEEVDTMMATSQGDILSRNRKFNTNFEDVNAKIIESSNKFEYQYESSNLVAIKHIDNYVSIGKAEGILATFVYDENDNLISKSNGIYFRTNPHSVGISLSNNKTITISFNYALDATADVQSMLAIREAELKSDLPALSIKRAYVNPSNSKELVIELNRPLEVREGFELYSTQDLPLKDGRFVPVSLVAEGSAATGVEQNVAGEILVNAENGSVVVSAPQGIVSAAIYSVAGTQVAVAYGGLSTQLNISAESLSSGLYYVTATDGNGNTSTQSVTINK